VVADGLDAEMAPSGTPGTLVIISHKGQANGCGGSVEGRWRCLLNLTKTKWGINDPPRRIQEPVNRVGITDCKYGFVRKKQISLSAHPRRNIITSQRSYLLETTKQGRES